MFLMAIYFVAAARAQDFCAISKSGIVFIAEVNNTLPDFSIYRDLLEVEVEIIHNTTSSYPVRKPYTVHVKSC